MNNFLTVIGSAAEGIQLNATEPLMKEDAQAILSMTERAAVLTRSMHLAVKVIFQKSIVSVPEILLAEQQRLQRLINANLTVSVHDADAHVFASEYLLRNIWMAAIQSFEDKETAMVVAVSHLSYHFSNRVLGLPARIYVIVSMVQEGFEWSVDSVLKRSKCVAARGRLVARCVGVSHSVSRWIVSTSNAEGVSCIAIFTVGSFILGSDASVFG